VTDPRRGYIRCCRRPGDPAVPAGGENANGFGPARAALARPNVNCQCLTPLAPVVSVTLGSVLSDSAGRPVVPYKLTLRDGSRLEGDLPFRWQPRQGRWEGVEGLDWHGRAKP